MAERQVVPEEPTHPPAVYLCEHKGLAEIYVLLAEARVNLLRGNIKVFKSHCNILCVQSMCSLNRL